MPSSSANFSAGMSLPRATPAMSGMMASTSEMPCSLQELLNRARHKSPCSCARCRLAAPNAANSARENGFVGKLPFRMPLHTQREDSCASATRKASITPSGARASTAKSLAQFLDSLPMQRIDLQAIPSGDFSQGPSRLQQHFVGRAVLHVQRRGFIVAVIEVARSPRAAVGARCRRRQHSFPEIRGRSPAPASRRRRPAESAEAS